MPFGDGICCAFGEGFYRLHNACGLDTANYEFASATDTVAFTLNPCLPVLLGCTNETAQNYNPWATLDNGSCEVLECDSLETLVCVYCVAVQFKTHVKRYTHGVV